MPKQFVKKILFGFLSVVMMLSHISCEGDLEGVGTNIVDNGVFDTELYKSEIKSYNENVLKRKANILGQYLLGVYKDQEFGLLQATALSQVGFIENIDFGLDAKIDTVIYEIPYHSTLVNNSEYELDSIYGNQDEPFELKVFRLDTYLNTLDPSDPSKILYYYTDEDYAFSSELYSGLFKPNANDTVLYVNRKEIIIDESSGSYDVDTIQVFGSIPTMKIPLDEDFFTTNFINNPDIFSDLATFVDFFRGVYLQANVATSEESSIMSLDFINSTMTIYYTNTVLTSEITEGKDLNGDGDAQDVDVPVRTKQQANFLNGGVSCNKYDRDYSGSNAGAIINNPDVANGDERIYVQGASGSIGLLELFVEDDLEEIRNRNLLVNNANLVFYVDQNTDLSIVPYRIYVYNYDENQHLADVLFEGMEAFGGNLEYDSQGLPYKYTVNVTDYISRVLSSKDPIESSKLAIKSFNTSDIPENLTDIEVKDYSWTPLGVVLHGSKSTDVEKQVKLEITYSELN